MTTRTETALSKETLNQIKQATKAGHGYGGGTAEWNGEWLATLDAERAARGRVEAARLFAAHMDVEGGYILTPDRHSHAYWSKVAARYNFLTDRAALSPSTTTLEATAPFDAENSDRYGDAENG